MKTEGRVGQRVHFLHREVDGSLTEPDYLEVRNTISTYQNNADASRFLDQDSLQISRLDGR